MKALVLTAGSLLLTASVVANAYYQKQQFYPSVVYITKSNTSMAVLYLQAFVIVILSGKLMGKIFFGQLRAAEMEHLIERSWYAVTETCLAFTVFREDFSPRFVGLFTLLLFLKCFHWLAEDRIDFMERSPVIPWKFHFRALSLMTFLGLLDTYFISHAYYSTIKGASVQLVFGFEYAILLTAIATIFMKYVLHTIHLQSENPWENKAVFMLYTDLVLGMVKMVLYLLFFVIMIKVHTLPLFAIRPMYLTCRGVKKALNDVIMSRRAIRNMNTLYEDATEEDLASGDNVCIICREEMTAGCKKLPCNHIFHTSCLRSWFQRQQICPTCRMDVLRTTSSRRTPQQQQQQQQQQQPQPPQAGAPGLFPGFPGMPAWPPQVPPAAVPPPGDAARPAGGAMPTAPSNQPQASAMPTSSAFDPTSGWASGAVPPFMMMPPFMMPPMPFSMPPPIPPPDYAGMSEEELRAMEGRERQHVQARIQCLRSIQTLLDAAMLQMQQYTNIISTVGLSSESSQPGGSSPRHNTSGANTQTTSSTKTAPTPKVATSPTVSSVTPASSKPETLDLSDLEGAVGYTPPTVENIPEWDSQNDDNDELKEIRQRRLKRFSASPKPNDLDLD